MRAFPPRREPAGRPVHLVAGPMQLLALLLGLFPAGAVAQEPAPPSHAPAGGSGGDRYEYTATVTQAEVTVDGVLDEAVWRVAERIPLPYETFPGTNSRSPVATDCRVAYDARALYLGCRAEDPEPGAVRAYISDRDRLEGQDRIVLGLSPHDDGRRAFLFDVNPLGVQGDALYDETRPEPDRSWDAIWESAGRLTADGYVVELSVPFRSLRFPERSGVQSWSFWLERYWPRGAAVRMQSFHEDEGEACRLCQVNRLTGLRGISSGGTMQLTPTVSAARVDERVPGTGWSEGGLEPEAGLDVAWNLTSEMTLNATVNPDFSQIEADVARLSANQRFALFFPERRPFFQEGSDFFATPVNLAFTRTIVDPDFGGKATGKVGGNTFGALVTRDRVTSVLVPGPYGSSSVFLEEPLWTGLGTYRRDVTHTATVGGLVTVREGAGYHNRVASADAFFRPLPALRVQLQLAGSDTGDPDGVTGPADRPDRYTGSLIFAEARFDNRTWFAATGYRRQDAGFRADAGFVPRTGVTQQWAFASRRWFGTSASAISELRLAGGGWYDHTTGGGELVSRGVWVNGVIRGPWQSRLFINPNLRDERFAGRDFRLAEVYIGAETRPWRWLAADLTVNIGSAIDYTNVRPAGQWRVEPAVTLRPGRHLETRLSYALQRLETREGRRILNAGVAEARVVYSFSHRAFLRAILQHRRTDREPATHLEPVTPLRQSAVSQLLFSYKVNPRTVLFLGYSDDRTGHTAADGSRLPLTRTGRAFFFKVGYAFQP